MGYLVFCYLVLGFYFVVFMLGTSYDMLRDYSKLENIFFYSSYLDIMAISSL